ncbi:hypothetical protein [Apilactobacillus micheneri]|uniref:hypothetical protein n=1 Tax=Apilactobacillus micheneri TaxID=1899430 RepID=UPI00112B80C2|nr:hypothetical protein [Apilactobacillus micheneri]TPR43336.1 hypothetical protein DY128_07355 [Apilactobacillus micheneri]
MNTIKPDSNKEYRFLINVILLFFMIIFTIILAFAVHHRTEINKQIKYTKNNYSIVLKQTKQLNKQANNLLNNNSISHDDKQDMFEKIYNKYNKLDDKVSNMYFKDKKVIKLDNRLKSNKNNAKKQYNPWSPW